MSQAVPPTLDMWWGKIRHNPKNMKISNLVPTLCDKKAWNMRRAARRVISPILGVKAGFLEEAIWSPRC